MCSKKDKTKVLSKRFKNRKLHKLYCKDTKNTQDGQIAYN